MKIDERKPLVRLTANPLKAEDIALFDRQMRRLILAALVGFPGAREALLEKLCKEDENTIKRKISEPPWSEGQRHRGKERQA